MKVRWILASTALFLAVARPGAAQDSALGPIASFSGSEVGDPATSIPDRGMVRCVGMNNPPPADGKSPPWCPNGTTTSVRGRIFLLQWQTSDPNTSGTFRYNLSFDVDSSTWNGSWWGNFVLDIPDKGTWVGWIFGESNGRPATGGKSVYRVFAVGEGKFAQCHLMAEVVYAQGKNVVTGRYLLPNGSGLTAGLMTPESAQQLRSDWRFPSITVVH
jgi:hypothetical protein